MARFQRAIDKRAALRLANFLILMPSFRFLCQFVLAAGLLFATPAKAQWVVYDLRINPVVEVSENFTPYTGLYVIAPVTGGAASMVFLTEDGGRFYNVSENGARYFTAAGPVGRLAVISAFAQVGTARTMYQCVGQLNTPVPYTLKGQPQEGRASTSMLGNMLAADDESLFATPGPDGSIGMVGTGTIAGTLRVDLSRILNQKELSMAQAVAHLTGLLEKYGYRPESQEPAPTPASPEPAPAEESASLFPPGTREELERTLNQPLSK